MDHEKKDVAYSLENIIDVAGLLYHVETYQHLQDDPDGVDVVSGAV